MNRDLRVIEKKASLISRTEKLEVLGGNSGKKCVRVRHYRMKMDYCRVNEPEVLNQVIDSVRCFNSKHRVVKGRKCGDK